LKGAFTPGCSEKHLPSYIRNYNELKNKGIDVIAVIAYNDAHVMAAWGKANNVKGDDILFLSDTGNKFSESIGWTNGPRLARYALVIDKGIVTYAAKDNKGEVDVSPISLLFPVFSNRRMQEEEKERKRSMEPFLNIWVIKFSAFFLPLVFD
jgi:peroxiredoxin